MTMMFREHKCDRCDQKELVPYSPEEYKTPHERMDFERRWDQRVAKAKA